MFVLEMPQVLTGFNILVNGRGNAGRVSEGELPEVKFKEIEVNTGGMAGSVKINGELEPMQFKFKTFDIDPLKMTLLGLAPNGALLLTFNGALQEGLITHTVMAVIGGQLQGVKNTGKKGEKVETEFTINVYAYALHVDGAPVYDIDVFNGLVSIGGVPRTLATQAIVGPM